MAKSERTTRFIVDIENHNPPDHEGGAVFDTLDEAKEHIYEIAACICDKVEMNGGEELHVRVDATMLTDDELAEQE